MMDSYKEKLVRMLKAKTSRREELSKLPFKKKIEILLELQKMARGVKRKGQEIKPVWRIEKNKNSSIRSS